MNLECFHGSPGFPEDFDLLRSELNKLDGPKLFATARKGYPKNKLKARSVLSASSRFGLAYSWGSYDCLMDAAQGRFDGVILVSPYLFPKSLPSSLKKNLLKTPLLGNIILGRVGAGIISGLLHETSAPAPIPVPYKNLGSKLADPQILKVAALEKRAAPIEVFQSLSKRAFPIALIYGKQDRVSTEAEQILPLRSALKPQFEKQINEAGHALLWTHPKELARAVYSALAVIQTALEEQPSYE